MRRGGHHPYTTFNGGMFDQRRVGVILAPSVAATRGGQPLTGQQLQNADSNTTTRSAAT